MKRVAVLLSIIVLFLVSIPIHTSAMYEQTAPPCGARTWDTRDLARKILACRSRIEFQRPAQRAAFQHVANYGTELRSGYGCPYSYKLHAYYSYVAIDPGLLRTLLAMTDKYDFIVIGAMAYGHDCYGGYHPQGKAVDINGVTLRINGKLVRTNYGDGWHIRSHDFSTSLLKQFYTDLSYQVVAQTKTSRHVGHGGLGQYYWFTYPRPRVAPGVKVFSDHNDHIHLDVGH